MTVILALVGLVVLLLVLARLVRLVVTDGYGVLAPPRSHVEELGPATTARLRR